MSRAEKRTHIIRLLDETDVNNKQNRDNICRSILYIAQGSNLVNFIIKNDIIEFLKKGDFNDCNNIDEYYKNLVENIAILYECDTFSIFTDLLMFEIK